MTRRTHNEYPLQHQFEDLRGEINELVYAIEASNNMTKILSGIVPCSCQHECTQGLLANVSHGLVTCCHSLPLPGCMEGLGVCMPFVDCPNT